MKKNALVVGINDYGAEDDNLHCCVNDANEVGNLLEYNENGGRNFSVIKLINEDATLKNIKNNLKQVFKNDADVGLFYFSGHGCKDEYDSRLCTYDCDLWENGLRFRDLLEIIQSSDCKNKIVILDCCFAGSMGDFPFINDTSVLKLGTTILTACASNETSSEYYHNSLFTKLLIDALKGGASDIFGRITPGSIYSYIDSSLGNYDQRPLFKSNVKSFITVRLTNQKMSEVEMKKLMNLFRDENYLYPLDSSFEPTNYPGSKDIGANDLKEPYFNPINGKIFSLLQKAESYDLIKPSVEKHMFYAALRNDTCKLTDLGKHYWWLVHNGII